MTEHDVICLTSADAAQKFRVSQSNSGTTLLHHLSDDIANVEIPAEIDGKPVTVIGEGCFFCHREIKSVVFPPCLESIGHSAFALCSGIHELIIPDSVTEIGPHAFRDCTGLRGGRVVLSSGLSRLDVGIFAFCYMNDVDIILPPHLKVIEAHAFYSAGYFPLRIPEGIEEIQTGAFAQSAAQIESPIPIEKRWFLDWPGGKEIVDSNGAVGIISDVRPATCGCLILTADMNDGPKDYFYPSVGEPSFSFTDPLTQKHMEEDLSKNSDAKDLYRAWQRGLLSCPDDTF